MLTRPERQLGDSEVFGAIFPKVAAVALTTVADISVVISAQGLVEAVTLGRDCGRNLKGIAQWAGRRIEDLVTTESRPKMASLLEDARSGGVHRGREINHLNPSGGDIPVRYLGFPLARDGRTLLLGRDLSAVAEAQQRLVRAQMALERDYEAVRRHETRYRVLMESSPEALVIADAGSGKIVDVNAKAARLLSAKREALVSGAVAGEFEPAGRDDISSVLASAISSGKSQQTRARTKRGRHLIGIEATLFRSAGESLLLCRLSALEGADLSVASFGDTLQAVFERTGDAVVITDNAGRILHLNDAFLSLVNMPSREELDLVSLGDFLERPNIDLSVMIDNAREAGRLALYATRLRSAYGAPTAVEISATHLRDHSPEAFAFTLRDVSRVSAMRESGDPGQSTEAMENVRALVGTAPLKELVAATSDVVERMCIETAITLTSNNRAAAAEMLGLSRQSLYVKLRKYGLIDSTGG